MLILPLPGHSPDALSDSLSTADGTDAVVDHYLDAIRDRFGSRRIRLVGHSTGALMALHIARHMPDSINDILAITPLFSERLFSGRIDRQLLRMHVLGPLAFSRMAGAWLATPESFERGIATVVSNRSHKARLLKPMRQAPLTLDLQALYRCGCWIGTQGLSATLGNLPCPVTCILGTQDPVVDPRHQLALVEGAPNASGILISSGHQPMLEQPALFANLAQQWRLYSGLAVSATTTRHRPSAYPAFAAMRSGSLNVSV